MNGYVIACILIIGAYFFLSVLFVVVVALFVFGGLNFDLVFRFNACVFSLFRPSLRRDLNKNNSHPCYYLRHVLEKTRPK